MAQAYRQMFCPCCNRKVRAVKETSNFIVHVFLIFVTCGMWLPVWLFLEFVNSCKSFICQFCGSATRQVRWWE